MSRLMICVCAAFATLAAQSAVAQTAVVEDALAKQAGAPSDVMALANTPTPIMGSLLGTSDLANSDGNIPVAANGFDTADWDLDESIGGPMVSLTDKALVAKGHPTLEAMGADTKAMQQGMSMEGGSVPTGSVMNTAPMPTIVSSLVGGILPK